MKFREDQIYDENVRSSGEYDEIGHISWDRCEDRMNEPAWILFIVIKYQVKSNNYDKCDENYLKCECLPLVTEWTYSIMFEDTQILRALKLKCSFEIKKCTLGKIL